MVNCDFHQGREAIAECTNCGRMMCHECSGVRDGSGLCPSCRGESNRSSYHDQWVSGSDPWSPAGVMDDRSRRYIRYGLAGSIINLLTWAFSTSQLLLIYGGAPDYFSIFLISLGITVSSIIDSLLIGIGFLGIGYKYNEPSCKYVLWVSVLYVSIYGFYFLLLLFGMYMFEITMFLVLGLTLSGLLTTLITLYALYRIRVRSANVTITTLLMIMAISGIVLTYSLDLIMGLGLGLVSAVLWISFFSKEQGESVIGTIQKW